MAWPTARASLGIWLAPKIRMSTARMMNHSKPIMFHVKHGTPRSPAHSIYGQALPQGDHG
jgi:hypothetical protein